MLLTTLPENAVYIKYGVDAYPESADKAFCDGQEFAKCWATGKWELVTAENPRVEAISYCGRRTLHRTVDTIGNAKRLAERWNNDPDTHPNQIITHLLADGKQYPISDRQFVLF
jgi:hypothetical protein